MEISTLLKTKMKLKLLYTSLQWYHFIAENCCLLEHQSAEDHGGHFCIFYNPQCAGKKILIWMKTDLEIAATMIQEGKNMQPGLSL